MVWEKCQCRSRAIGKSEFVPANHARVNSGPMLNGKFIAVPGVGDARKIVATERACQKMKFGSVLTISGQSKWEF